VPLTHSTGTQYALGWHMWDISLQNAEMSNKIQLYSMLTYITCAMLTKVSILLLYLTIFGTASSWYRYANYVVMFISVVTALWAIACTLTQCVPLEGLFRPWDFPNARCWPREVTLANNSLHFITDLMIFALPWPLLHKLQVPRRQRFILAVVFSLGFFVCCISIARIVELAQVETNPAKMADISFNLSSISYWNSVELNLGITVACLITLRPLAARFMPQWFSVTNVSQSSSAFSDPHRYPRAFELEKGRSKGSGRARRGDIESFGGHDGGPWLDDGATTTAKGSDFDTTIYVGDLGSKPSRSTLKAGGRGAAPGLVPETRLSPRPQGQRNSSAYLSSPSEKDQADERHTSGFLESASDEELAPPSEERKVYIRR
jgi:hypothetical protein